MGGVRVTVRDLNGKAVKTLISDDAFGAVVFNANDFVCDYDKEMELSLTVEAEALGYRDFSIPWLTMKRGGKRTETLVLLSGPEDASSAKTEAGARFAAEASVEKPYVVSCYFNGYDVLRQDKSTPISKANDAKFDFELVVSHPAGMTPKAPVLHCWIESPSNYIKSVGKREYTPTRTEKLSGECTRYVYTDTWKRDLSPDITVSWTDASQDQRPYFVLPDTGEVVRTTLVPVRAKVNQPIVTGQETKNPLNQVMGKGFGLDIEIPGIGGRLSFGLPFEKYLPKVSYNPIGYVTVMFGASGLKDPADATLWKNKEAEAYDKAMKQYEHEASIARQKQKLGTAKQYYKGVLSSKGQARMKLDFGYFLMLSGRGERDADTGGVNWTVSGAGGGNLLFSVDYTHPFSIGPVPVYVNINFSACAGICLEGLYFSFAFDHEDNYLGMDWWVVRGVTIDIRLALTVTLGIGSFDVELWLTENGKEVQKIETLHADCLYPGNSRLVLHTGKWDETVAKGEVAFYRLKDFEYSPRQREWIVRSHDKAVTVRNGKDVATADGSGGNNRLTTNVLVPGALGGYTGSIKIPTDWKGKKALRLKLVRESTYSNWLAAAALAQRRPELFAEDAASGGARFAADAAQETLEKLGIRKLVYELDEDSGRLVLRQPEGLFEAGASGAGGDGTVLLYASEIEAPEPVDIDCDVHDIDVGHRLWTDYYGEAMLDIVINDYHTAREAIELICAVYLDGARTPRYVSLPYDPGALSAGKTTTITLPLKTFIPDVDRHREARVVITARNVAETATVNNEFTLCFGRAALTIVEQPRSVTVPVGGRAAFTVGVTSGTPPYQYQWQVFVDVKWQDVPGANAATLTLEKVKAKWNGRKARCVVTDAAGDRVVSDAAVLTVTGRPNTGDNTHLPLYLAVALIAAAILLILRRRERDQS